ncbi:predicted protein [Nematostella vectensis]|uniref:Uncharacterized protein n=1 Tax=Nematostella vectensis TaxID=45351 RepID=A7SB27_NEMVE|nr:predicted protein [Nematostella vectensis]|eukprot:XP_001631167.1 predicted protein [Nematostella vectensis]
MSRSSNFILLSFAILNAPDDLLSSKGCVTHLYAISLAIHGTRLYIPMFLIPSYNYILGTHTVAVINGPEKHDTIAESLKDVLEEIDAVQDHGYVELDGKSFLWAETIRSVKYQTGSTSHLSQLVQTIRLCGVSFQVWEKLNADGRRSGTYDFTSLIGSDRKKLLKELPEKLIGVLQPSTAARVAEIWKAWLQKERVTCYMHVAAYHVPAMIRRYQNLKQFSGQGLEKNNDDARRVVLRKYNHLDDPCEVLRAGFKLGKLKHRENLPRPYVKRNAQYWEEEIKMRRRRGNTN